MLAVSEWGLVDSCESQGVELVEEGDLRLVFWGGDEVEGGFV